MLRMQVNKILFTTLFVILACGISLAQTSSFTYQGRLSDGSMPANGNYDLQFALFDSASGGAQIGQTQSISNVSVSDGVFAVTLDFGASAFPGASRFLEISARLSGAAAFTLLTPRQQITSTPYAIRSLNTATADTATNAQQLGGVDAGQFVKTDDARMTDARDPKAGNSNYVQNTTSQQAATNFNISGNGTAGGTLSGNILNATTQYDIAGQRVLGAQTATGNTFLGLGTGAHQTIGTQNSFFGSSAGLNNTSGSYNSFFGNGAGLTNTTGYGNAFFGIQAGKANTTGTNNVLIGDQAGVSITTGSFNTAIGDGAGFSNTTESYNTFLGVDANGVPGITNATALGANATVTQSDTMVLGNNARVGIGTSSPIARLQVEDASNGLRVQTNLPGSILASFGGYGSFLIDGAGSPGGRFAVTENGNVGIGTTNPVSGLSSARALDIEGTQASLRLGANTFNGQKWEWQSTTFGLGGALNLSNLTNNTNPLTIMANGKIGIGTTTPTETLTVVGSVAMTGPLGVGTFVGGGNFSLCLNTLTTQLAFCSSSLRYKTDLHPFARGLDVINRLRPITFKWKSDQSLDLGFGAEDVAAVDPLLVTRNEKGQVEGVKYDRLSTVFVNAFKEQQAQIERQQAEAKGQQDQIALLRAANDSLNARLRNIEIALQRHPSTRHRR